MEHLLCCGLAQTAIDSWSGTHFMHRAGAAWTSEKETLPWVGWASEQSRNLHCHVTSARLPGGRIMEAKLWQQELGGWGVGGTRIFQAVGSAYGKAQRCEIRGYLISFSPPDHLAKWMASLYTGKASFCPHPSTPANSCIVLQRHSTMARMQTLDSCPVRSEFSFHYYQ